MDRESTAYKIISMPKKETNKKKIQTKKCKQKISMQNQKYFGKLNVLLVEPRRASLVAVKKNGNANSIYSDHKFPYGNFH